MLKIKFENDSEITTIDSGECTRGKVRTLSYEILPTNEGLTYIIPKITKALKVSFEEE